MSNKKVCYRRHFLTICTAIITISSCSDTATLNAAMNDDDLGSDAPRTTDVSGQIDAPGKNDARTGNDVPNAGSQTFTDVGLQLFKIEEGPNDRILPVAVWYPATNTNQLEPHVYLGFIPKAAVLNLAPALDTQLPVVVFSHGNRGVKEQSVTLMEEIARAGYIVLALDHVGNTFFEPSDEESTLDERMNHIRPLDVSHLLDWLEQPVGEQAWLSQVVDLDRIGAIGHSRGGYTVLALAGADVGLTPAYLAACEDSGAAPCQAYPPEAAPWDFTDDRIRTSIAYSPASYSITPEGLASVTQPILVMTGKEDQTTTYLGTVRPIYDGLPSPKTLWTSESAGHYAFSDLCRVYDLLGEAAAFLGADCDGRSDQQIDSAHDVIARTTIAWLNMELRGAKKDPLLKARVTGEYRVESE